jgi:hypothetical protein
MAIIQEIKANPEAFKFIKKAIAENDERFKHIKSMIYECLLENETTKEKCEFLISTIKQIGIKKLKHEAEIHEKSTLKQKLNAFEKKEIIFSELISFCKHLLKIHQEILKEEESLGINIEETSKKKGSKLKREANDKLTCLSQEQTALLIYYLQQEKVLLKDEYLSNLDAGKAFEMLTAYSQNTLRQNLGQTDQIKTKENLTKVANTLTRLGIAVANALRETRPLK